MADSSSKEAMRALAVFLGAYMQGKQADKERAAKDHWEQVHYDLAKQQLAISEKNSTADRAMRQAAYDLDKQQFDLQKTQQDQTLARQMSAAKQMGFDSPEAFKMNLDKQNSDAMAAYRESRSPDSSTSQIAAFSTAIDDTRFEMQQVQSRMSDLQKLMSDPMADAVVKEQALSELATLQPRYQQLDVELTNLKGRRMNLMSVTPQMGGSPAPDATKSGAAQMPKADAKPAQKANTAWPKDATGKPKRMEEMNWFEPPAAVIGAAVDPLMKGAAKMDKAASTAAKGFMAGFGHQTGTPFNSPLPGGGTMLNTGINPEKLKEYLGKAGATKQPKNLFEGIWDSLNGQ